MSSDAEPCLAKLTNVRMLQKCTNLYSNVMLHLPDVKHWGSLVEIYSTFSGFCHDVLFGTQANATEVCSTAKDKLLRNLLKIGKAYFWNFIFRLMRTPLRAPLEVSAHIPKS